MDLQEYFNVIQTAYMEGYTDEEVEKLRAPHDDKQVTYREAEELGYFILRTSTEQFAYLQEQTIEWREELYKALRIGGTLTLEKEKELRALLDKYKNEEADDEIDKN